MKRLPLTGTTTLPGDKSLSHRAAMFSPLARGTSTFTNISDGGDVASTIACLSQLGAEYDHHATTLTTRGSGLISLSGKDLALDCGNSGTSLRLLCGLLSGQNISNIRLVGDASLSKRPQGRVIAPLASIGVDISSTDGYSPVTLNSSKPHAGHVDMVVASAQVKSAVLLAGLYADGPVSVQEMHPTRNHTENMLSAMGVELSTTPGHKPCVTITPPVTELSPLLCDIPGDPSSAAFFGVIAAITPGSSIVLKNILINQTRIAWVFALKSMGANIEWEEKDIVCGESVGDISVSYSQLKATEITGNVISSLVDELPILALAMAVAEGTSIVKDAAELRVKESDRISVVVDHLTRAGISIIEREDGYEITGGSLSECEVIPQGDHRIAMTFTLANFVATGDIDESHADEIATSFPRFFHVLNQLIAK